MSNAVRPIGASASEAAPATRLRTFLKGVVYYDHHRVSIECTIRDISDTGARLAFIAPTTVPDHIELFIPQKQRTFLAQVQRRDGVEIGVAFQDQRSIEPRRVSDLDASERIAVLESEVAALKRIVKKLQERVLPHDFDAA